MPMKTYEVELKRVSYVTYIVQALDETDAEDEAWKLLEKDGNDNGAMPTGKLNTFRSMKNENE
jgi:hypothetical protein